jgi:hypothetical protein
MFDFLFMTFFSAHSRFLLIMFADSVMMITTVMGFEGWMAYM